MVVSYPSIACRIQRETTPKQLLKRSTIDGALVHHRQNDNCYGRKLEVNRTKNVHEEFVHLFSFLVASFALAMKLIP
jgi:hypothetical protein